MKSVTLYLKEADKPTREMVVTQAHKVYMQLKNLDKMPEGVKIVVRRKKSKKDRGIVEYTCRFDHE